MSDRIMVLNRRSVAPDQARAKRAGINIYVDDHVCMYYSSYVMCMYVYLYNIYISGLIFMLYETHVVVPDGVYRTLWYDIRVYRVQYPGTGIRSLLSQRRRKLSYQ